MDARDDTESKEDDNLPSYDEICVEAKESGEVGVTDDNNDLVNPDAMNE